MSRDIKIKSYALVSSETLAWKIVDLEEKILKYDRDNKYLRDRNAELEELVLPETKQTVELDMIYYYKGASCCYVRVESENSWIKVFNDYNELMFSGVTCEFVQFLHDLRQNKFS